jgi:putative toxin-antitoxin system antitoxin component (TIGR02293 family)
MNMQSKIVAGILGLKAKDSMSKYELAQRLAAGLPVSALDRVCGAIAPEDRGFCLTLIPRATITRRRAGNILSPSESELLGRLAQVWAMALDVFQSKEDARRFLHEPHMLLHGERPIDVARTNAVGAAAVEEILGRLHYGSVA